MNRTTSKVILPAMAFATMLACTLREGQAEVRRGILFDIFHYGRGCDPSGDCPPIRRMHGWLDGEMAAEKARIREEVRVHRLHHYLHNQDHKKLLHPECSPYHDCYWGIYPTCWRQFPGRQLCPPNTPIYESGPYPHSKYEYDGPELESFETDPSRSEHHFETPELGPPAAEAPAPGQESETPLYFE